MRQYTIYNIQVSQYMYKIHKTDKKWGNIQRTIYRWANIWTKYIKLIKRVKCKKGSQRLVGWWAWLLLNSQWLLLNSQGLLILLGSMLPVSMHITINSKIIFHGFVLEKLFPRVARGGSGTAWGALVRVARGASRLPRSRFPMKNFDHKILKYSDS